MPAIVFVIFVLYAQLTRNYDLFVVEFTVGPLIWGLWNVGYFIVKDRLPKLTIGLWGALLGLIFGIDAIFRNTIAHSEALVLFSDRIYNLNMFDFFFHKLSFIWLMALYFLVWHYAVRRMNNVWGCKCR